MAFGNSQGGWKKIYYFDPRTKKDEAPYFKVTTKNAESGDYEDLPQATFVDGYIHSMYFRDEEDYEGRMEKNLYLKLFDGEEMYVVRIKFFMVGRSIMNSLASLVNIAPLDAKLTIRLYRKKSDKGEWFNRVYVGYGVEALDWYMTPEEMRSYTKKVTVNGKELTDTSALDKKLQGLITMAIQHVEMHRIAPVPQPRSADVVDGSGTHADQSFYSDPRELEEDLPAPTTSVKTPPTPDESIDPEPEDDLPF